MRLSEQALATESVHKFPNALVTAADDAALLPGAKAEVPVERAERHVEMPASLLSDCKNEVQVELIPEGIKGLAVDDAEAAEDV